MILWPRETGLRVGFGVTLAVLLVACGGEPEAADETAGPEAAAEQVEAEDAEGAASELALQVFTRDAARRVRGMSDFPHEPHVEVDCAECHASPAGHGVHLTSVSCAECHEAGTAPMRPTSPEECQSCHHDPGQLQSCESCHIEPVTVATQQAFALEVWDAARTRELSFGHEAHVTIDCASCHMEPPSLEAEACATCHEDHHAEEIDCVGCHEVAGPEAHDFDVHRSCSGSGCHRDPGVEAISMTRTVCLACHVEQVDHEPEGDCVDCHQLRGEGHVFRPALDHEDGWSAYRAFTARGSG